MDLWKASRPSWAGLLKLVTVGIEQGPKTSPVLHTGGKAIQILDNPAMPG